MTGIQIAIVQSIELDPSGATRVLLDTAPGHRIAFEPGELALVRSPPDGDTHFAFASSPDLLPRFEFLISSQSERGAALFSSAPAGRVALESPRGKAFEMERLIGRDVLLVGTGSAISPLRSAIQYMLQRRRWYPRISLLYGCRAGDGFCYPDEIEQWREAGVEVLQTASQPDGSGWEGRTGRVQEHLAELLDREAETFALVCGGEEMVNDNRRELQALGLPANRILTNF